MDVVLATAVGGAGGGAALAAAVGVAAATGRSGQPQPVLVVDLDPAPRSRRPTMLASAPARELEDAVRALGGSFEAAAARGHLVQLALAGEDGLDRVVELLAAQPPAALVVVHLPQARWPEAVSDPRLGARAGLLAADLPADRALVALAVSELHERGLAAKVAGRPLGRVAARRALAGIDPGGAISRRAARFARSLTAPPASRREDGQALLTVLGAAAALIFAALVLTAIGGAVTGTARVQRAADLAALSGARSMRDDFERLFAPARLPSGTSNPAHLTKAEYLARARAAAIEAAGRNGVDADRVVIAFPDAESFSPLRIRARIEAEVAAGDLPGDPTAGGHDQRIAVAAHAVAEASPPSPGTDAGSGGMPAEATGGGYSGPLAYRQGKPMRPDVAAAFDRLAAAAHRAGISLAITSAFRSDAEQAELFAQHPDPTWVAPPGQSLHRCATELDLGPSSAYGWLAAHARDFGFLKRYSWEPWHFGYVEGPPPCSAEGDQVGESGDSGAGDGSSASSGGLPDFVPEKFRAAILRSAAKWNVSASLLAAQLFAESNFNPYAVSPAGAQGIAQFMPGTAASYGLGDPFDAEQAIDAQAHLMSDLLKQFGSVQLALAAYNAGPGAVAACDCVPSYPETQAYVARIMGLLDGAGELVAPVLEVRLVE